jgi:hypothetical protein
MKIENCKLTIINALLLVLALSSACFGGSTIKALVAGNWSATGTWVGSVVPAAGDTADFNGLVIVMDTATIPTTGTSPLLAIISKTAGVDSAGQLTVDLTAVGNRIINATTATAGTNTSGGLIKVNGGTYTLTYNGNLIGGSAASVYGLRNYTVNTINFNGNITGGSAANAHGVYNLVASTFNMTGNLIFSNYTAPYMGYSPVFTAGSQYYIQMGGIKFPQQLLDHQIAKDVNSGGLLGVRVDCPVAKAVSTSGNYGDPAAPFVGTYHEPEPNEVWHTAVFGANSGVSGTKAASSITNCTVGNVKSGITIDDVVGEFGVYLRSPVMIGN